MRCTPADALKRAYPELAFRLANRPPTPPLSAPGSPRPSRVLPPTPTPALVAGAAAAVQRGSERQALPLKEADVDDGEWGEDGWRTVVCSARVGGAGALLPDDDDDKGMRRRASALTATTPAAAILAADVDADDGRRRRSASAVTLHLLTTPTGVSALTRVARDLALAPPSPPPPPATAAEASPGEPKPSVRTLSALLAQKSPFDQPEPDLLVVHSLPPSLSSSSSLPSHSARTGPPPGPGSRPPYWSPSRAVHRWAREAQRGGWGPAWASVARGDSVGLYGVGGWPLRVTEIQCVRPLLRFRAGLPLSLARKRARP